MSEGNWFADARYGMFVHYGLYSLLQRGEWVWNREEIPRDEYVALAGRFRAEKFDADALCRLAVDGGMRYLVFTTMHHDGFRLYPTELSDFHIGNSAAAGRDLVGEMVDAARRHGLRIGLYHSLNNWHDLPDAVDALEDAAAREVFLAATHARIRELLTRYPGVDILWYDGWWPFNAEGWRAEEMNDLARSLQPGILCNGRNGLPGDFATPEQHLAAPQPWRPWEACVTLNESWGFHIGDHEWKSPSQVLDMLSRCAQSRGNLLLNIGPGPDGVVPQASREILGKVGAWLRANGRAAYDTSLFTFDLRERGDHRSDWNYYGPLTSSGNSLFWWLRRVPGPEAVLGGVLDPVCEVKLLETGASLPFVQRGTRLEIRGVPPAGIDGLWPVLEIVCDRPPTLYQSGGLRVPSVEHPHYDPCPSDILHG